MNKQKYTFHPDLKPYETQHPVLIPGVVSTLQKLMGVLYGAEKDDADIRIVRKEIPSADGDSLRTLIYTPTDCTGNTPCLLFLHGGGFVFNAAPHHFALTRKFTRELQVKTVFVDYRLAPKYKFPTAPNDCMSAYRWLLSYAGELGIDTGKILVCGDSAGGNLATVLCLMARDTGLPMPKAQMLLYPFVDRRMNTESCRLYTDTPMCNTEDMRKYLKMYVKDLDTAQLPYLSPMEAPSLSSLPPAYMEVAQYDCLHDKGIAYAKALEQDGVSVELHEIKGAMHGYDIAQDSGLMNGIMEMRLRYFQKYLSIPIDSGAEADEKGI